MEIDDFSLEQGTIEFWVKANKFEWDNNERIKLFEVSRDEEGKILIFKDEENKLRAVYRRGEDRSEISTDVSGLSSDEKHQIAFSWEYDGNEVNLYLDGEKIKQDNIY